MRVVDAGGDAEGNGLAAAYERVRSVVAGNAVVLFGTSGCCMCHVVKSLLLGFGVGPVVVEVDREAGGRHVEAVLCHLLVAAGNHGRCGSRRACPMASAPLPAVFVGGRLLGGLEAVMACHINGSLVPLLKEAGALWL